MFLTRQIRVSFFAKLRLSFRPQGTTRLTLDGFSRNLIFEYFSKIFHKANVSSKLDTNNGYSWNEKHFTQSCRENQNTCYVQ